MSDSYTPINREHLIEICQKAIDGIRKLRDKENAEYLETYCLKTNGFRRWWNKFGFRFKQIDTREAEERILRASNRNGFSHWEYPNIHGHKTLIVALKLRNLAEASKSEEIMVSAEDWSYL